MIKLNPSVKFIYCIILGLLIAFTNNLLFTTLLMFVYSLVLIFCKKVSTISFKTIILVGVVAVGVYFSGYYFFNGNVSIADYYFITDDLRIAYSLMLSIRIFAYFALGMLFSTTTNLNDFAYSMHQQLKVPEKFSYGLLASFNIIPLMKSEYAKLKYAYQARGMNTFILNYNLYVPLLFKSIRWSEILAIAMESKGFDENITRSNYKSLSIHYYDYLFLIISFILIIGLYIYL